MSKCHCECGCQCEKPDGWIKCGNQAQAVAGEVRYIDGKTEWRCTHIDERIRGKKGGNSAFAASNRTEVVSMIVPDIDGDVVFCRGYSVTNDNDTTSCDGNRANAIALAINEANAAWWAELEGNSVACCVCGKPVDTREQSDGGDANGAELSDGRWACSHECWDKAAGPLNPAQPAIDWEQRRWEAAVAAMQGMLADCDYDPVARELAEGAVEAADALIAAFNGGSGN